MKARLIIYFAIAALAILAVLLWRPARSRSGSTAQITLLAIKSETASNSETAVARSAPMSTNATLIQNDRNKPEVFQQVIEQKNLPIDFYAQIVDQNGNPISGVKVEATIRQWFVISPTTFDTDAHFIPMKKETDLGGRFEIRGVNGDIIEVESIQKDTYLLSPKTPHGFSPHTGSLERPTIIRMWKEGLKEQLVSGSHVFGIDSGKTYTLDLLNGKKIEGETEGDLRVLVTRPSDAKPRDKFPWSFSIEAIGGGLVEADPEDEFMYLAPESGYVPKVEAHFDPSDPTWVGIVKKRFFIRSRNSQVYGRAEVEVDSIYNVHSAIQINYAANPAGSRNLEPK
jgi:hypothetical protein